MVFLSEQVASVGPKMFSEAIFEDLILKIFLGSMPIDPPSCCMIVHQVPSAAYAFHVSADEVYTAYCCKMSEESKNCLDKRKLAILQ